MKWGSRVVRTVKNYSIGEIIEKAFSLVFAWPCPKYELHEEPEFLFLLTLPNSGSTALANILNTSYHSMLLQCRGEAMWLIRGAGGKDRWDPTRYTNWKSIKHVWYRRIARLTELHQKSYIYIEKSPSNIVRVEGLLETFPNHTCISLNRNPYASVSSRYFKTIRRKRISDTDTVRKKQILKKITNTWIERSRLLKQAIETNDVLHVSYESFCEDTDQCIRQIQEKIPQFHDVNPAAMVKVKAYKPQQVKNYNEKQISRLSTMELDTITEILRDHVDILSYFNYTLID